MPLQVSSLVYSLLFTPFLATGIATHPRSPVKLNEEGSYFFNNVPPNVRRLETFSLCHPQHFQLILTTMTLQIGSSYPSCLPTLYKQ